MIDSLLNILSGFCRVCRVRTHWYGTMADPSKNIYIPAFNTCCQPYYHRYFLWMLHLTCWVACCCYSRGTTASTNFMDTKMLSIITNAGSCCGPRQGCWPASGAPLHCWLVGSLTSCFSKRWPSESGWSTRTRMAGPTWRPYIFGVYTIMNCIYCCLIRVKRAKIQASEKVSFLNP